VELSKAVGPVFAYNVVRVGGREQYDLTRDGLVAAITAPEQPFAISVKSGRFQAYARCRLPLTIRVTQARDDGSYPEVAILELQALELDESVVAVMEAALELASENKRGFGIMDVTRKVRQMRQETQQIDTAATARTTVRGRRTRGNRGVRKVGKVAVAV